MIPLACSTLAMTALSCPMIPRVWRVTESSITGILCLASQETTGLLWHNVSFRSGVSVHKNTKTNKQTRNSKGKYSVKRLDWIIYDNWSSGKITVYCFLALLVRKDLLDALRENSVVGPIGMAVGPEGPDPIEFITSTILATWPLI